MGTRPKDNLQAVEAQPTIATVLRWGTDVLTQHGIEDARTNVELFVAHLKGVDRTRLFIDAQATLTHAEAEEFRAMVARRIAREPAQYIIGETEFMGLKLIVDRSVLIPRPETEILVEKALGAITRMDADPVTVLDIGTGSGNIAIALASFCSRAHVTAIDVSPDSLRTASRNIIRHGIKSVILVEADLFSEFLAGSEFHLIISNPPYVSAEDFEKLQPEIRDHEPRGATTDGDDGLLFLRRILQVAPQRLSPGGALLLEIGYGQAEPVRQLASDHGFERVVMHNDLAGIPRVLEAWNKNINKVSG